MDGFPSGQREQTVNLPAPLSVVRIHPRPPKKAISYRISPFVLLEDVVKITAVFAVVRASLAVLIFGVRPLLIPQRDALPKARKRGFGNIYLFPSQKPYPKVSR